MSQAIVIIAGIMFLAAGVVAYITDLNKVGAIILAAVGIGGIIAGLKGSGEENTPQ